jgi:threonine/homoserine/homoserine lactone efflux protein
LPLIDAQFLLFLTASLALVVAPGPDSIYVLTRGVGGGRKVGLVSAVGVCSGLLVHTAFAAVGISAVLAQSALAFSVVKYVGAAYLVYLGVRTLLNRGGLDLSRSPEARDFGMPGVFWQGFAVDVLNPKPALFFLAFLPQFADPAAGSVALQILLLGLVFVGMDLACLASVALFSGAAGEWIKARPRFADGLRWATGCVLVGLGLRLALPERT